MPVIGVLCVALFGCAGDRATRHGSVPQSPGPSPARLQTSSTPEAQGIDSRDLIEVLQRARREDIKLHSLIVARHGTVVLEVYVPPYGPDTLHNVKSVTKSVLSALTGVAIDRGCLQSIDTPVADLLPEHFETDEDPRKRAITARHLLTMTAGLDLDENGPKLAKILASDDWVSATLAREMTAPPGEEFLYSSPLSHMLAVTLSRTCGMSLLDLCRTSICDALGIERLHWRQGPRGHHFGGADLYVTPSDMLEFGMLFLNDGRRNGRQVVSRDWVKASTSNQIADITDRQVYGFGWWPVTQGYKASGWGGQRIWVAPKQELVVVATMAEHDGFERLFDGFELDHLSDHSLPENDEATTALAAHVASWSAPAHHSSPSDLASTLSGQVFTVDPATTSSKLRSLSFEFPAETDARLVIRTEHSQDRLSIGLDGRYRTSASNVFGARDDGLVAMRGHWTARNRFDFELVPVGEPVHVTLTATFFRDSVTIEAMALPDGNTISIRASRQQRESTVGRWAKGRSMPQRLEALPEHSEQDSEMDKRARPASDARVPPIGVLGGSRSAKP